MQSVETDAEIIANYYATHENVQIVNYPSIKINLIESWCAVYRNDAEFKTTENKGSAEKNDSQASAEAWSVISSGNTWWPYENCPVSSIKSYFASRQAKDYEGDLSVHAKETIMQRYNDIVETTQVDIVSYSYTNGTVTSPAFNQDIVDLFNVRPMVSVQQTIRSVYGYFEEALESNEATANMIDLIGYIFNKITDTENYYSGGEEFETLWSALHPNVSAVAGDIIVDTANCDSSLVINDVETLKKAFSQYNNASARQNLIDNAQLLLDLQNTYHVNALFAAAVSKLETQCGTDPNSNGYPPKNNWFGIECTCGNSSHGRYETYSTAGDSITAFFKLISNNYLTRGQNSVYTIAVDPEGVHSYCPENDEWPVKVSEFMVEFYSAAGITVNTTSTTSTGESQDADGDGYSSIYTANGRSYKEYKQSRGSYKNETYSGGTISSSGCGPTSVAIVASGYGSSYNPGTLVAAAKKKYGVSNFTASPDSTGKMLTVAGLNYSKTFSLTKDQLEAHLKRGKTAVLSVNSSCGAMFTNGTHYIAILDIDVQSGKVYVSNPNPSKSTGWIDIDKVITCNSSAERVAFLITN